MLKKLVHDKKLLNEKLLQDNVHDCYYGIRGNKVIKIMKWIQITHHDYSTQLSKNIFYSNHFINLSNIVSHETTSYSNASFSHQINYPYPSPQYINHKYKFCNFNSNGAKRNLNFIHELVMRNDFLFICETWLLSSSSSSSSDYCNRSSDTV